ncbi:MAG: ATP-binding cassette domain-containing protein, partial [Bradyrhizobium sp.]|nr:ATP-binding cassette domain-containing protein [Bradyrhizobium sp.]
KRLLEASPPNYNALILPRPTGRLDVQSVVFGVPGTPRPIIKGISFNIGAGETLGIIGPSGAGKSTLARLLVGVTAPSSGAVRLDGADIAIWPKSRLGRHIGYLPQDVELFADTIGANIGRFERGDDAKVIEAAKLAGVHDMVLGLPQGYDTQVGEGGAVLSGGYRQRIGLARAVFGNPAYIVLDEPSSNLDAAGDAALAQCIEQLKEIGTTIVLISHRTMTISSVDKLLVLRDGMIDAFGGRQEVIARISGAAPLKAVPSASAASNVGAA